MPKILQENNGFPVEYDETDNFKIVEVKAERNAKLAETDVYMVEDFPITTGQKTAWQTYRQSLRDMNFSDPDNITWPTKPE
tara:strand:- start:2031 stop:2273 length:243 start_codon:yes stop_codon:yes gene_type:complete